MTLQTQSYDNKEQDGLSEYDDDLYTGLTNTLIDRIGIKGDKKIDQGENNNRTRFQYEDQNATRRYYNEVGRIGLLSEKEELKLVKQLQ